MIQLTNRVKKININEKQLIKDVQTILDVLKYSDYDIGILLTTNKSIQTVNRTFRNKDKPTDILSFPYHTELKAGTRIKPVHEEDKNLGDLIISLEYVQKDAVQWHQTFEQRMRILLVHGICHLLGYDHINDADYVVMQAQEDYLLQHLTT